MSILLLEMLRIRIESVSEIPHVAIPADFAIAFRLFTHHAEIEFVIGRALIIENREGTAPIYTRFISDGFCPVFRKPFQNFHDLLHLCPAVTLDDYTHIFHA